MDSYTVRKQTLKRRITIPVNGVDESKLKDFLREHEQIEECCQDVYGITDVLDEENTKKCVLQVKGTETELEAIENVLERKNLKFEVSRC